MHPRNSYSTVRSLLENPSVTFDRWMELDMDYIDRWSLWLDLKILIQVIKPEAQREQARHS
jgi:lipopolysaccharide/colanic/teichoic acid biosynthesis glycosyltransferase